MFPDPDEVDSWAELLEMVALKNTSGLVTAFVAHVVAVHAASTGPTYDVQPIVRVFQGGVDEAEQWANTTTPRPQLPAVPAIFAGGAGQGVKFDLRVGDRVLCLALDRSHAEWQAQDGDDVSPQSPRMLALADVRIVGLARSNKRPMLALSGAVFGDLPDPIADAAQYNGQRARAFLRVHTGGADIGVTPGTLDTAANPLYTSRRAFTVDRTTGAMSIGDDTTDLIDALIAFCVSVEALGGPLAPLVAIAATLHTKLAKLKNSVYP